ncbi:MAG: hypothetical protein QOC92_1797 [Acidimicrobiaceae bacterium]|jgi:uncharacterized protein (TIGR03083 family)
MSQAVSPSIDHLQTTWRSIDELCSALNDADWVTPTGCPGWTVQDNVSHLIDYEARALGRPGPEHTPADVSHTKNAMGESNEVGVDFRRAKSGAEVLDEFREVTAARLAQLHALTADDLKREIVTPAGPGTLADMLRLREMDTWTHEQDMRRAVGRPGNTEGPAAQEAVEFFADFLPLIIGKRAETPDGASVVVEIGKLHRSVIEVADGRAKVVDHEPETATVTLTIPPTTFAALVGGRSDAPDDAEIKGDESLGRAILAQLGFMP